MSRSVTVHEDNKENIPCVTRAVSKITSVASGAVHTTSVCVIVCVWLVSCPDPILSRGKGTGDY